MSEAERELLSQWREQGADLTQVNDQLILRQNLPADLQDMAGEILANDDAMVAIRNNPKEAIAMLYQSYQQGLQQQQALQPVYSPPAPMGQSQAGDAAQLDAMIRLVTQPNMPEATSQILGQDASLFRILALAGDDFNPYASVMA
ncbi:MAG: hypothetical protein HC890_07805 [Chloroflexaceae bacterium]|nr:hypothetical protein [Chloroflexaceae bacterium]